MGGMLGGGVLEEIVVTGGGSAEIEGEVRMALPLFANG